MFKHLLTLLLTLFAAGLYAELALPTVFSDHMVLQREKPVPVWGTADPGATLTVEFAGQIQTATADASGKWRVNLEPLTASKTPGQLKISSNGETVTFNDVLVGEVWLCSGQSNMQWRMDKSEKAETAIAAASRPLIRLYNAPHVATDKPRESIDSRWTRCTPQTVPDFSAVAYYFGLTLQNDLDVPVGLLVSAWSGTRIEPWIPPCGLEGIDSLANIRDQINPMPKLGANPRMDRQFPTALYNGMLHAHVPFALRGAIWYQGEANRRDGMLYVDKTRALLNGWRELWNDDFPFYFVQIAPYQYAEEDPDMLPAFWEAQAEIVKQIPQTGMAVVSDATTLDNIHPPNKEVPGTRLARLALANTYGRDLVSTGPLFKEMTIKGNTVEVSFDSAEGLTTRDGKAPDWFEIGGDDGIFRKAAAEIKGSRVLLTSPEVAKPLAMRFAWHKLAVPNLVNGAGLPAAAFRAGRLPKPKAAALPQIPELDGYRTVYQLMIPADASYESANPAYDVDNSADSAPFTKIAYVLELQKKGGDLEYAFASMDAFTDDLKKTGVPTVASGAKFMQKVSNLTVRSNVDGITACTDSDGGNIEFWPGNYGPQNSKGIPGADDTYDFGDAESKIPGYGSMQVHNWKEKQTVFAINRWGGRGTVDIGIGNSSGKTSDWTFSATAGNYAVRRLTVLVK